MSCTVPEMRLLRVSSSRIFNLEHLEVTVGNGSFHCLSCSDLCKVMVVFSAHSFLAEPLGSTDSKADMLGAGPAATGHLSV